jgi:hypothetical protein
MASQCDITSLSPPIDEQDGRSRRVSACGHGGFLVIRIWNFDFRKSRQPLILLPPAGPTIVEWGFMKSEVSASPLASCGKPLFFLLSNAAEIGFPPPLNRRGEALRTWVRSLSAMQKEAVVASARTGCAWRLASDEGPYLMGDDVAPCPLAFMTTGMVAGFMNEILVLAQSESIRIRDIRLVQDNFYTMTGSIIRGTMIGGTLPVELKFEIDSDAGSDALFALVSAAVARSPVSGLLGPSLQSQFTLTHNGCEIDTGRVARVPGPPLPDAARAFDHSIPAAGYWTSLITRAGLTPDTGENTSFAGSSLADEQNRRLHVQGTCTLGPGGIKQIEQHLYNPRGSIFRFLSDEPPQSGGQGRAPDAATYISAGIAFCYMTQLGRYAKIVKKDLKEYRIVQDTHFSPGEPAGVADPVETHVYLVSDGDDSFARTALDMSEQTCFLHALCRTPMETRIRNEVLT